MSFLDDILRMLSGYGRDFGSLFDPENYDDPLEVLRRTYMREGDGLEYEPRVEPEYGSSLLSELLASHGPSQRPVRESAAAAPLFRGRMTRGGRDITDEASSLTGGFGLPQGTRREGGGFSASELTDEARRQGWGMESEEFLAQLEEAAEQKKRENEEARQAIELEAAQLKLGSERRRQAAYSEERVPFEDQAQLLGGARDLSGVAAMKELFARGGRGTDAGGEGGPVVKQPMRYEQYSGGEQRGYNSEGRMAILKNGKWVWADSGAEVEERLYDAPPGIRPGR